MKTFDLREYLLQFAQVERAVVIDLHRILLDVEQVSRQLIGFTEFLCALAEDTLHVVARPGSHTYRVRLAIPDIKLLSHIRRIAVQDHAQTNSQRCGFREIDVQRRDTGCGIYYHNIRIFRIRLRVPFIFHLVVIRVIDIGGEGIVLVDIENTVFANKGRNGIIYRDLLGLAQRVLLIHFQHNKVRTRTFIRMAGRLQGRRSSVAVRPLPFLSRGTEVRESDGLSCAGSGRTEREVHLRLLTSYQRAAKRQ